MAKKFIYSIILTISFSLSAFAAPIKLPSLKGEIVLPKSAIRIIVLEFSLLDDLLQLGVKPVAIASSRADEGTNPPFLLAQLNDVMDVGTRQQPNLEKIMSLHPDLIIADITMQANLYPLLTKIAPTLMLNGLMGDPATQIENMKIMAKATNSSLNVQTLANELKSLYANAKKIGSAHPARIIIGYASSTGQFQALTANALTSSILQDFSHPNLITVSRKEQSTYIPLETLIVQNPDSIVVLITDNDLLPYHTLIKNPLWKKLRAVKTKHIYLMDRDIWAKNHGFLATKLLINEAIKTGFLKNQPNE